MTEFDIDNPPDMGEDESPSQRRRRERRATGTKSTDDKPKSKPTSDRAENAVAGKLNEAFSKLSSQLAAKGDEELATAIAEEARGMSNGLMSLTRSVTFLRNPMVVAVELALVFLAFWRVGRILFYRALEFRQKMMFERAQYGDGTGDYPEPPIAGGPIFPDDSVMAN